MPDEQTTTHTYHHLQKPASSEPLLNFTFDKIYKHEAFYNVLLRIERLLALPLLAIGLTIMYAAVTTLPVVPVYMGVIVVLLAIGLLLAGKYALRAVKTIALYQKLVEVVETDPSVAAKNHHQSDHIAFSPTDVRKESPSSDIYLNFLSGDDDEKDWSQTVQTAELNRAAQRSVH